VPGAKNPGNGLEWLVAQQRTVLIGLEAQQAAFRAELARNAKIPGEILDSSLKWRQRVRDVAASREPPAERRAGADALYFQLVDELQEVRAQLRQSLEETTTRDSRQLRPLPLDSAIPPDLARREGLTQLRLRLLSAADTLLQQQDSQLWERRKALHDAMVMLNGARLDLIDDLPGATRRQLLGFGSVGLAQVNREVSQMSLEGLYNIKIFGRHGGAAIHALANPTPALVMSMLELLLALLLFRLWRRGGDDWLARARAISEAKRPATLRSTLEIRAYSLVQRVRAPFDLFVFVQIVRWLLPDVLKFPGIEFVWIVLSWLIGAALLIRLIDGLASGTGEADPRAELRLKSLRLVGAVVVFVGMTLRLTSTSVGHGAIYSWVLSLCALLIPVIVLILAHWWRERIVELSAEGAGHSAILAWTARNANGVGGLLGRAIGGIVLLVSGLGVLAQRQANNIALVRDIYGQRARRRAAQQAALDRASGRYIELGPAQFAALQPHRLPGDSPGERRWPGGLQLHPPAPGAITAVVGERGLGKSAMLDTLHATLSGDEKLVCVTARGGVEALLEDIAAALGGARGISASKERVLALLEASPGAHIAIDDVQRLMVPAIGGLRDFDTLIALARSAPRHLRWTMTIGGPAWEYLSRARSDRLVFDAVIRLPRWAPGELRQVIEARTREAGLDPDFHELPADATVAFDSKVSPDEHKRHNFFEHLCDQARGNPAAALEFWRRSLFVDRDTGAVVVRTFETPDLAKIVHLPAPVPFVLRAIVQMDKGVAAAIERSTDLPPTLVADALRGLERIGAIEPFDDGYRVTLYWWNDVIRLLERQNLIVGEKE
jgi:hypothetical protein